MTIICQAKGLWRNLILLKTHIYISTRGYRERKNSACEIEIYMCKLGNDDVVYWCRKYIMVYYTAQTVLLRVAVEAGKMSFED